MAGVKVEIVGSATLRTDLRRAQKAMRGTKIIGKLATNARNYEFIRVTTENKDVDGQKFPGYSTKPIRISLNHNPKPQGGRRQTKTGKKMLSVSYENGYAEFRQATFGHKRVQLFASGSMFRARQGKALTPTKAVVAFTRDREAEKGAALQAKYKFVGLSEKDQDNLQNDFELMVDKLLKQANL